VRVIISEDSVKVLLAPWEKMLGLMGNITVPRVDISDVHVVDDPVREAMDAGIKVGLRLPLIVYVARTMRFDQMFVVRRGVPGLAFAVRNHRFLKRVLVSTPDAVELARELLSS
jgi:hypothetical protein